MNKSDTSSTSKIKASTTNKLSSTGSSSPVLIPTPTSTEEPEPDDSVFMETESSKAAGEAVNSVVQDTQTLTPPTQETGDKDAKASLSDTKSKSKFSKKSVQKSKNDDKKGKRAEKKKLKEDSTSESDVSDDSDSDDESSEDERVKRRKKSRAAARKAAEKKKAKLKAKEKAKKRKNRKIESSDESESGDSENDSSSESESEDERSKRKAKAKAKSKKSKKYESSSEEDSSSSSSSSSSESDSEVEKKKRKNAKAKLAKRKSKKSKAVVSDSSASSTDTEADSSAASEATNTASTDDAKLAAAQQAALVAQLQATQSSKGQLDSTTLATLKALAEAKATTTAANAQTPPKKNSLEFKRVDQVWDSKIRDYKYTESVEDVKDEFDCVFTVRRRFGWDNKYLETMIDIKSKVLRGVLQIVFKDCKSISLVEDKPSIHPHFLFHYYGEIKAYVKKTLKPQLKKAKKRKEKKLVEQQIRQGQLMLKYIDEDYEETRKQLKPMFKAGTITYDLVWALFKPNTIAYTTTYGNKDDPRCFKVEYCYEQENWMTGEKNWMIEGRYLEYDGKVFGFGEHYVSIRQFRGSKKISTLSAYPLKFHKEPEKLQEQLIERGKKFVSLQGMNYMKQEGLGYVKYKNTVLKHSINGRVMVDPAIFRRLHPNYALSYIKQDELGQDDDDDEEDDSDCCCDSESDDDSNREERPKTSTVMWRDKSGRRRLIRVPKEDDTEDVTAQKLDVVANEEDEIKHVFSEEELLIASPVVLGFSFSEKLWLEFSLSGISEIKWQTEAFESLVLPAQIKQNLKGLVSSHRFNAAKTIDDVIVGKGKGLNVVLHGPPGVGKTLTGESIAEFLRCPLYMVSSGELGTSAKQLEHDLNRIMEITHAWGAILLLDEADVFLEARQPHDIHRNALVSVFLRLTEYYQGILFLTTNRVATFDEAFQSRIHMGIRYEQLTVQARKKIWMHYVGKVLAMDDGEGKTRAFADSDFDELSRKTMNGRQIKNAVKTSQSIAISEKGIFGMDYVKRVMESHETFEEDMKGGRGYRDAMRHYT